MYNIWACRTSCTFQKVHEKFIQTFALSQSRRVPFYNKVTHLSLKRRLGSKLSSLGPSHPLLYSSIIEQVNSKPTSLTGSKNWETHNLSTKMLYILTKNRFNVFCCFFSWYLEFQKRLKITKYSDHRNNFCFEMRRKYITWCKIFQNQKNKIFVSKL